MDFQSWKATFKTEVSAETANPQIGLIFDLFVIVCSVNFGLTPRQVDAKFSEFSM